MIYLSVMVFILFTIYTGAISYLGDIAWKRYHVIKELMKENEALKTTQSTELNINGVEQRFWCLNDKQGKEHCGKICTACNVKI